VEEGVALSQRRRRIVGRLQQRKTREREGAVLVEGVRAVTEALAAGATVRFGVTSPRLEGLQDGTELRQRLFDTGVDLGLVDDAEMEEITDTEHPQGIVVVCDQPSPDETLLRAGGRYLVLDAVQDPGNVGTLIRAATAFALDGIVALDGTADPWGTKAVRASAGMVFRQNVLCADAERALGLLSERGLAILVADMAGRDVASLPRPDGWALVVGNEGAGARAALASAAHATVRVPMPGPAESLNVGVAAAVLLYALICTP
jgi:TrmH family RNA methyltransferase